ncbi:MAG: hypothetical protein KDD67_05960 [Ignavibacteriae bacterium]|nr:hypothetical protein [Ignavibacteriota bacterium]MCB9216409.1 hypothetical protein [Ignavibacteria bacterium]
MSRIALTLFLLLNSIPLFAQGGYAGSSLRRTDSPAEASMSGVLNIWAGGAGILFGNPAALTQLKQSSALFAFSFLQSPQKSFQSAIATPIDEFAGIGIGISGYRVSDIDRRAITEQSLGFTTSQDLAVTVGGGLGIGPGSIGGSIRYLRYDLSGIDGSSWGVTLDLSGMILFRNQLAFGVALNNIAGSMNASYREGLHERIPTETRLTASYIHPLEERTVTERVDPTGTLSRRLLPPRTYILTTGEIRYDFLGDPTVGIALEAVPTRIAPDAGIGFRLGTNTKGDFSGGFFIETPLNLGDNPRLSFAARREYERGEITLHMGLEVGL